MFVEFVEGVDFIIKNSQKSSILKLNRSSLWGASSIYTNDWCQQLLFVIMDECHFFVADSLFNEMCGYYLDEVVWRFSKAIRIYLTATSWDVLYPIADAEKRRYHEFVKSPYWQPPRTILRYYFPRNFDNYRLNFIEGIDELSLQIEAKKDEKWLVFIDNREKGRMLASKLSVKCDYIDAESKGSAAWKYIVEQERFEQQVLITTSVLDNGVNISDETLKNIAIFTDNRTSLIQMLGRKRCSKSETVNLWVCDIPQSKAVKHYNDLQYWYSWFELFDCCHNESDRHKLTNRIWYSDNPKLRKLFNLGKGRLYVNEMARFSIKRKLDFYRRIVEGEITFQNAVQQWLDKPVEQPQRYIDKLTAFCKEHLGTYLSEHNCQELRLLIVKSYEEKGYKEAHRSRVNELKERSLNNRLFAIGLDYQIESVKSQWILRNSGEGDDLDLS